MSKEIQKDLLAYVIETSGQDVLACYHCQKCVAGCPTAPFMDIQPNVIHRMLQYGQSEEILKSATIWICAACETCGARCPNDIDIAKVNDALKQFAVREGIKGKEKGMPAMHSAFLAGIEKRGRMHEVSLIRDLRMKTGGFFKDMKLGIEMFKKGKLTLFPEKVKDMGEIKKMFQKARKSQ